MDLGLPDYQSLLDVLEASVPDCVRRPSLMPPAAGDAPPAPSTVERLLALAAEAAAGRLAQGVRVLAAPAAARAPDASGGGERVGGEWGGGEYFLRLVRQLERAAFGLPPFPGDLAPDEERVLGRDGSADPSGDGLAGLFRDAPATAGFDVVMHLGTCRAAEHVLDRLMPRAWTAGTAGPRLRVDLGPRWVTHDKPFRVGRGRDDDASAFGPGEGDETRVGLGWLVGGPLLVHEGRAVVTAHVKPPGPEPAAAAGSAAGDAAAAATAKAVADRWAVCVRSIEAWAGYLFPPDVEWAPAFAVEHPAAAVVGGPFTVGYGFTVG